MSEGLFYLKPNLVMEPLIDNWYAWSHLISPATAAMNIVGRHLKIMNSYIQSPQIHAAAVMNPMMLGGPFMDYKQPRVEAIKQLRDRTLERQDKMIRFAAAIKELDMMLKSHAKGFSLESLYPKVPEILKGYVELVYDLNNHPSFRVFESLLYKSEFYDKSSQSVALWLTENDERPFCLSTPRLEEPHVLHLDLPFDHPGIDALGRMKRQKGSIGQVAALLGVRGEDRPLFDTFFTQKEYPTYRRYEGPYVRMRYFGHACILIETREVSVLVDPLISYYGYESSVAHFSDVDIPDTIDYVLITHNHQDHILLETLLPMRHKIGNIIVPRTTTGALQDPSLKLAFNAIGFDNVIEIDELEQIRLGNCTITGVPFTGEHSDLNVRAKTCYHVALDQFTFLFVADSRILERKLYEHVHRLTGDIDVLFLGMECEGAPLTWLYGPLLTEDLERDKDRSRRLSGSDFEKGMHLVDIFHPREAYVYAMGQEPWLEFISSIRYTKESHPIVQSDMLVKECSARGIIAERLYGEKELLYNKVAEMV
ncbi:MBL fold metallo-hydrolase [Flavitalea sp. BT771]|uniref:MBL fold metallo-hydrolase n=1 Tax=Flavitalea sp. BT771 TaxID=3063329 RepID=UPI0026E28D7C|nr:MBL fold metallo-hydrolase [Flavitalea sp. BT771]MDO6434610.1 MBL fold metallo-hydrolase [Flavitalea sp. BT771]MDV6223510.1 MBL fold metallo-hydrolase [Flavitalea sp. BT771]